MRAIRYIFLTVTIVLVTVFYIININASSQDIIAAMLPKTVLVANNAGQEPNEAPTNKEVVAAIDDYAHQHNLFIISTVVVPEKDTGFHPEYMTFGSGKLSSNMTLFPKENRANNDVLGAGATYHIVSGQGSSNDLSQYLSNKFHVTAAAISEISLLGEYYNVYGNPQAVVLFISLLLTFVGISIFVRISKLRKSGIEILSGKTLLKTGFSDSINDVKFLSIVTVISMTGILAFLLINGITNLSVHIFALFSILLSSLIFIILSFVVSCIITLIISHTQLSQLIKGKLPVTSLMIVVISMQFVVSIVLVTSISGIRDNQIELRNQEASLQKWEQQKNYYTLPFSNPNLQVSDKETKAWWNFYNAEVSKYDAIFVKHNLFDGLDDSGIEKIIVTPSYLKEQKINVNHDFSKLKLGEYGLLIPKNQIKNKDKLITHYNQLLTDATLNGDKTTEMKAKYIEEIGSDKSRFIYNVAYNKLTRQQEVFNPIIIVITPQSSGVYSGLSWAQDNDYLFVKGKEQAIKTLKQFGLYDKIHYIENAYGQYEAQTELVKTSLNMAIVSSVITIVIISFFYILLHVLYFTHFRRTIVIKVISGMKSLRIHHRFILLELGLLLISLPLLTVITQEFLYSLYVVFFLGIVSSIILSVQIKFFEQAQLDILKGE